MEKDTQKSEESKSKPQVDIEEVQKSLKSILGQVKNVEENLGIIKKSIGKNEIILSSVANDIEQMSIKLIKFQNSGLDSSCSGNKYPNWNAELLFQEYKKNLRSEKNSECKFKDLVDKKVKSMLHFLKCSLSDLLLWMLIGLLVGFVVTKIFIDREANLAVPVFLILLIIWRGMGNYFKNFREEDKILATNALNSMLTEIKSLLQ